MNSNDRRLYQAEVARRAKEGIPDGERPSLLGEAISIHKEWIEAIGDSPAKTAKIQSLGNEHDVDVVFQVPHHAVVRDEPPRRAEWIVALCLPPRMSESVLGDLHEIFLNDCKVGSRRRANQLFWLRAVHSLLDAVGPIIAKKLSHWGAIAVLVNLGRRLLP
jgi:hypothetical protein